MPASANRPKELTTEQLLLYVPRPLRLTAAWGWRLLVLAAVVLVVWKIGGQISSVVVPVFIALMVTAALYPIQRFLTKRRVPNWLGALICMIIMAVVLVGLFVLVVTQLANQGQELVDRSIEGFSAALQWLADSPLHIDQDQVQTWINDLLAKVQNSQAQIAGALASFGGAIGEFFAGLGIVIFAIFFFLMDGKNITKSFGSVVPHYLKDTVLPPFKRGWDSLVAYMGAAVIVAGIDGIGAGLGALILGSNLWLAIGVLTFLLSFIPLIGAFVAGTIATAVVLVTLGPIKAIIMLVVFVAVMSIEGNVLQPLILGKAAEIHPLIVLVGIAIGANLAGIPGALFAIPLVAFISGMMRSPESEETQDAASIAEGEGPASDGDAAKSDAGQTAQPDSSHSASGSARADSSGA